MPVRKLFTSESVTEGHPDKVADQISDAILDHILEQDPYARVACETLVSTGLALVAGEVTTSAYVDIPTVVRGVIKRIGYTNGEYGFDCETCAVMTSIKEQSPDIAAGVGSSGKRPVGAGDQGMMFGFACEETPELMPLPIQLAHRICRRLAEVRKDGRLDYLRPDGKSQVTIAYEDGVPVGLHTVVVSAQHDHGVKQAQIRADVMREVVRPVVPPGLASKDVIVHVNPTGVFVTGGAQGRLRPDGPKDHRGHLRRLCPARGRRLQRQGPFQGGPLRGLRRPLHREERRGLGAG